MGNYPGIYRGADYGFDAPYEKDPFGAPISDRYSVKTGQFGITTDPRSANQLKEVSDKLSTGAKTIEISGISTEVLESIPDQHLEEIARLKKLAGADITFHGPLVEPTGFNQQGQWEEASRVQAERQIWDAVKRGQKMMLKDVNKKEYEKGNLVVTLHTSNGLLSPRTVMKDEKSDKVGVKFGKTTNIAVIDEDTGQAGYIPIRVDEFESPNKLPSAEDEIDRLNKKAWNGEVTNLSISVDRGRDAINQALRLPKKVSAEELKELKDTDIFEDKEIEGIRELYRLYKNDYKKYDEAVKSSEKNKILDNRITELAYGEGFVRDAYGKMKSMYTEAKHALQIQRDRGTPQESAEAAKSLKRLEEFREEASSKISQISEDPLKIKEFADEVSKGMRILSTLDTKGIPQKYRKMEEFAVEQASRTFSNVALNAYKEFGDNAPILSLENPPVGMGLSRADEIKKLVDATRGKITMELSKKMSEEQAKKAAEKLVGVTWDVGHINMLKKYGFNDKDIVEETKIVKPYLKHIHLSDNFGLEHTELPMGMGNVPMQEHTKAIGEQIKNFKHIIETGGHWYQDFKVSPLPETLAAFGSELYPMQMQPHWDQAQAQTLKSGYFSGYGFNPEVHHSIYGAGFSNLPVELGGQIQGRNRLSGNPLE